MSIAFVVLKLEGGNSQVGMGLRDKCLRNLDEIQKMDSWAPGDLLEDHLF